ncbi:MAG: hypothetical protein DLM57_18715 [Pseudonocardiales bacterium]|nr:MAG: hypothetical protein DLM57_18715 [Pseudonocardiales bacterium]
MRLLSSGVAAVVAVALVAPATAAHAATGPPVHCGAVITANVSLTQDLHCSSGVGLTLNGNVTLDLNGHWLIGPGKAKAAFATSIGVALVESRTPRVRNGTITGWGTGTGPSPDNGGFDPTNATFGGMTYLDNGSGLSGFNSTFDVANTQFVHNATDAIGGLSMFVTVRSSTFLRNGRGISVSGGGAITLNGSTLEHNGVAVSCSEVGCTISQSRLRYNSTAIAAFFAGGKITSNDVSGNGIGFRTDYNPDSRYAHELSSNVFTGNTSAVVVNALGSANLHDNIFTGNGVGFTVPSGDFTTTTLLERNVFTRNGDGVHILAAGTSLKNNAAIKNNRFGIYAIGAVDLGGNVAFGNGHNPQCVGVTCSSH